MLAKRIIPCLDVRNGKVVKGVNFEGVKDVGDPVECAEEYNKQVAEQNKAIAEKNKQIDEANRKNTEENKKRQEEDKKSADQVNAANCKIARKNLENAQEGRQANKEQANPRRSTTTSRERRHERIKAVNTHIDRHKEGAKDSHPCRVHSELKRHLERKPAGKKRQEAGSNRTDQLSK